MITSITGIQMSSPEIALLNCPILTQDGEYALRTVDLDEALRLVGDGSRVRSFIGHSSTAAVLETLLGFAVPVSRAEFKQEPSQRALVFSLRSRQAEGVILSRDDIMRIGFDLKVLTRSSVL